MLGAIAGDLAAWTYENDREKFYSSLISERAELSVFGRAALDIAYDISVLGAPRSVPVQEYAGIPALYQALSAIRYAQVLWSDVYGDEMVKLVPFPSPHGRYDPYHVDKESFYFTRFLSALVRPMLNGASKAELRRNPDLVDFFSNHDDGLWKTAGSDPGLLTCLSLSWRCFSTAWDFTSAIHNAARCEGVDRHFLCSLTGVMAESMYGCEYRLLKEKYGSNCYHTLEYPESIKREIKRIWDWQWKRRVFFPKNSALTNVERHIWTPFKSVQEGRYISSDLVTKILRAFHPDWENRFGFYLDDGWVYCYRSNHILCRFHLAGTGVGYCFLMDIQSCSDDKNADDEMVETGLEAALRSAEIVGSGAPYSPCE